MRRPGSVRRLSRHSALPVTRGHTAKPRAQKLIGNSTRFARQDGIEEIWRVMQPLLDSPPPVQTYQPGSWGPTAADVLPAEYAPWREPKA